MNEAIHTADGLAVNRTAMAANRTLMAWIRTSLSLISFGFTIYKFLQAVAGDSRFGPLSAHGPRRLGLFLIGLGTLSVLLGSLEYFFTIRDLSRQLPGRLKPLNFTFCIGIVIALLGLFLFVTIVTNREVF